jgi:hypothetical protein
MAHTASISQLQTPQWASVNGGTAKAVLTW